MIENISLYPNDEGGYADDSVFFNWRTNTYKINFLITFVDDIEITLVVYVKNGKLLTKVDGWDNRISIYHGSEEGCNFCSDNDGNSLYSRCEKLMEYKNGYFLKKLAKYVLNHQKLLLLFYDVELDDESCDWENQKDYYSLTTNDIFPKISNIISKQWSPEVFEFSNEESIGKYGWDFDFNLGDGIPRGFELRATKINGEWNVDSETYSLDGVRIYHKLSVKPENFDDGRCPLCAEIGQHNRQLSHCSAILKNKRLVKSLINHCFKYGKKAEY